MKDFKKIIKVVLMVFACTLLDNAYASSEVVKAAVAVVEPGYKNHNLKHQKEEEFEEVVAHYVKNKKEDETVEDVRRDILSGSKVLNYPEDVKLLSEICDLLASKEEQFNEPDIQKGLKELQNLQKTFDALKVMMRIPEEVKIMFSCGASITQGAIMGYNSLDRVVFVYPQGVADYCKSTQLFTLIHELTHAQQHMKMGLLGSKLCSNVDKEFEADSQAAQAIKCPMCMQAIEADCLLHEQTISEDEITKKYKKGYLVGEEITEHKNTKLVQDLCSFHKAETPLNQQLQSASLREVFDIDHENGSLFDRLSTVKF